MTTRTMTTGMMTTGMMKKAKSPKAGIALPTLTAIATMRNQ